MIAPARTTPTDPRLDFAERIFAAVSSAISSARLGVHWSPGLPQLTEDGRVALRFHSLGLVVEVTGGEGDEPLTAHVHHDRRDHRGYTRRPTAHHYRYARELRELIWEQAAYEGEVVR